MIKAETMKKLVFLLIILFTYSFSEAKTHHLYSPDKQLALSVNANDIISFSVTYKNKTIIENSTLELKLEGFNSFGKSVKIKKTKSIMMNTTLKKIKLASGGGWAAIISKK